MSLSAEEPRAGPCRSIYKAFERRDEFQCNQLLGFPRVALLFQSAGELHHEKLWRAWLEGVAGLVPLAPDGTQASAPAAGAAPGARTPS